MNSVVVTNIIRFVVIIILQVLIFKGIDLNSGSFQYFHILFYPILILLLPFSLAKPYQLLIAFTLGFVIDIFYDSLGVHTSAIVFMTYCRSFVLKFIEPRGGYSIETAGLGNAEFPWFIGYLSIMMVLFLLFYFSMEAFSAVYFWRILLNTLFSFVLSVSLIIIYQLIFRTKR